MTDHLAPCEQQITEDNAFIAKALESASVPALMIAMVHMSGDASLLEGDIRPGMAFMGEIQGFLTPEQQAEVRRHALRVIRDYRDGGCQLPAPPDRETVHKMMQFVVGDEVPEEYVDMMIEDSNLYGEDARAFRWDKDVDDAAKQNFRILVIGAGQSGVLAGIRLNEAGIPYTIVEKNSGIGGTWFENDYPGARVDVANHFYSYSFEPNHDWPHHYSRQPQLAEYFDRCAEKYAVKPHIQFDTEVSSASYDEATQSWNVVLCKADGSEESQNFNAIISGVGQLNRPKFPDIADMEKFKGASFHSSLWNYDTVISGKRIAVIGTGASAFQIVPEVAKVADKLTVFQRSPNWMFPNPRYHEEVAEGKIWLLKHLPYYARWYRFMHFWMMADKTHPLLFVDPDWPEQEHSISEMNEFTRVMFTEYMEAQCGEDQELLTKVIPTYPPMGKRTLQDNGSWLTALKRGNVDLITDAAVEIGEDYVVDASGKRHEVDIIVYATGFHASRFLWPMEIKGRNNIKLQDWWGDDPKTNLGITTPHFPNLFCVYGPGNNLGHGGSLIFYSECQIRYILGCVKELIQSGYSSIECTSDASDAYYEEFSAAAERTVWAHKGMSNWYKNSQGKVTTTSPWRLIDFWSWTKQPDMDDFILL